MTTMNTKTSGSKKLEEALLGFIFLGLVTGWVIQSNFVFGWNVSESLPYHAFVARKGTLPDRGDLVAFRWHGGGHYPAGAVFVKVAAGVPGDTVERAGSEFLVNGRPVGIAKPFSLRGEPLEAAEPGRLGEGEYYVMAPNTDSLDSRYKLVGRVSRAEIIGKAHVLF